MKKSLTNWILVYVLFIAILVVAGCSGKQESTLSKESVASFDTKLVGQWAADDGWRLTIKEDGTVYYSVLNEKDNQLSVTLVGTIEENAITLTQRYNKEHVDYVNQSGGNYTITSGYEHEEDIPEAYFEDYNCAYIVTILGSNSIQITPVGYGTPNLFIRIQ